MRIDLHLSRSVSLSAEAADQKSLFEELAGLADLFGRYYCQCCDTEHPPIPQVREVDGVKHYELRCQACAARLSYGKNKTGDKVFPRKTYHAQHPLVKQGRAKAGDRMPDGGWEKWEALKHASPDATKF